MKTTSKYVLGGVAILVAIAATAAASTYMTRTAMEPEKAPVQQAKAVHHTQPSGQRYAAQQPAAGRPPCDDHNIIGTVGGAVAGGVIGSQFGKGSGKGLATAGGAVAGGALGNAYVPTRGATCD